MRNKIIFALVLLGVLGALGSAYVYAVPSKPLPPVFNPAPNPYAQGIYANGIVESYQSQRREHQHLPRGRRLHRAHPGRRGAGGDRRGRRSCSSTTPSSARPPSSRSRRPRPRRRCSTSSARSRARRTSRSRAPRSRWRRRASRAPRTQLDKQQRSYELDPRVGQQGRARQRRQRRRRSRRRTSRSSRGSTSSPRPARGSSTSRTRRGRPRRSPRPTPPRARCSRSTPSRRPTDGIVLSIDAAVGSYVSPQGAYDTYTQGFGPVVVMGTSTGTLARALLHRRDPHPAPAARRQAAGADVHPRARPRRSRSSSSACSPTSRRRSSSPTSGRRRSTCACCRSSSASSRPPGVQVYPGELVDVYVGEK